MNFKEAMRKVNCGFQKLAGPFMGDTINQHDKCEDGVHCPRTYATSPGIPAVNYARYLPLDMRYTIAGGTTVIANRVDYCPFDVPFTVTIDRIGVLVAGTGAGNLYVALYESVNESPTNRLAVSANTAIAGLNRKQLITIPNTQLTPGTYFMALESNNGADILSYSHGGGQMAGDPPNWYSEALGAYLVPPAIATPALNTYAAWLMYVRVASIP